MLERFTRNSRALVIAPAGCGKTHLLTESLLKLDGRQLILTHTNAGVKELRRRLKKRGIESGKFNLKTIDAFCFGYVSQYRTACRFDVQGFPSGEDWMKVKSCFFELLDAPFVADIVQASYSGVLVDEYQDCSVKQHQIITKLSALVPTRIVGDPMQGIFDWGRGDSAMVPWGEVEEVFECVGELTVPHRWRANGGSAALGEWTLKLRESIVRNARITKGSTVKVVKEAERSQLVAHLHDLATTYPDDSIAVIFPSSRHECWKLAGCLKNRYEVLEDADCRDLLSASESIDRALEADNGEQVLTEFGRLIQMAVASLPPNFRKWIEKVNDGGVMRPRRPDYRAVIDALQSLKAEPTVTALRNLVQVCEDLPGLVYKAKEIWRTFVRAIEIAIHEEQSELTPIVRKLRQAERLAGRRPPRRCISTTLLLKGLEFDHVVLPDFAGYGKKRKHLYVAVSRAVKTLSVFVLKR